MLCLLLATGTLIAPWYLLVPAVVLFLLGTEILLDASALVSPGGGYDNRAYVLRNSHFWQFVVSAKRHACTGLGLPDYDVQADTETGSDDPDGKAIDAAKVGSRNGSSLQNQGRACLM